MERFPAMSLADAPRVVAPDGSDVRPLLALTGGSLARFELGPGRTSLAIRHRTVEELWYVLAGRGEMWRRRNGIEAITPLVPGACLAIPLGTAFQFRALGAEPLAVIAITMPPWPGDAEAEPAVGNPAWDADQAGPRAGSPA
jgi:mannose-6-phosphate isomerase-like protein (cupin superfamily)